MQGDDRQDGGEVLVGVRNDDGVVDILGDLRVALHGDADDHGVPRLDLLDVAEHLLVHVVLGGQGDDRHALDDEGEGAVLELASGVGFGVDIGDFLELERAFEGHGVVERAADEEDVLAETVLLGEGLNRLDVFEQFVGLAGQLLEAADDLAHPRGRNGAAQRRDVESQHQHADELRGVSLGGSHGDFRAGPGVDDLVGLAGDRRADDVGDRQRPRPQLLGLL